MRQQAEPSSAMIANFRLPHFTLAQHFVSNKSFNENPSNAKRKLPNRGPPKGRVSTCDFWIAGSLSSLFLDRLFLVDRVEVGPRPQRITEPGPYGHWRDLPPIPLAARHHAPGEVLSGGATFWTGPD
jgi:hypothetical protein